MPRADKGGGRPVLWPVLLTLVACGTPHKGEVAVSGTTAAERVDEARSVASKYIPDGVLCEILGLGGEPPFGDGLCPDWTYSFHSAGKGSVVRVHLGRDGLFTVVGEPEELPPGRSPPGWDGVFSVDSDFAAKLARIAGADEFLSGRTPVSERLRLFPGVSGGEPVWEVTCTIQIADGFESHTVLVDATTARVLENEGSDR
ncbi:hypothetical protein KAU45_00725 [bacterium]|nr:hypothetical protein [bacterium]